MQRGTVIKRRNLLIARGAAAKRQRHGRAPINTLRETLVRIALDACRGLLHAWERVHFNAERGVDSVFCFGEILPTLFL